MTQDEVRSVIIDVLREVQQISGREWGELPMDAAPIGCLDGFDSLGAVEATVMIEEKLGCNIEVESVFVSESGKRALTLEEVAERLCRVLPSNRGTA